LKLKHGGITNMMDLSNPAKLKQTGLAEGIKISCARCRAKTHDDIFAMMTGLMLIY
jgi:hypothetical protein